MSDGKYNVYSAEDLLEATRYPLARIDVSRDALPNGLSLAMAPVIVNWKASSVGYGAEDYYILKNVNIVCNPVGGSTTLGTVRVHASSIERIEWVFVVSRLGRRETQGGHAMIRVVFRDDRLPTLISNEGDQIGYNSHIEDLVFSWEAWRPPLARFDPVDGLDPETYALSLRCFWGPVRCMSDALFNRPWVCYPLRLPDIPNAADDVLYSCLLLGDAVARQTIGSIFDQRIDEGRNMPDGYEDPDLEAWEQMREAIRENQIPECPIDDILAGKTRYHLLERSCVTMALTTLDAAHVRMRRRAGRKEPKRVRVVPGELPAFVEQLGRKNRRNALLGVPAAVHWLVNNQTVIPGKAHELLDEVGLLSWKRGELVKSRFDNREESPYGPLHENLIY